MLEKKITADVLKDYRTASRAAKAKMSGPEIMFQYTQLIQQMKQNREQQKDHTIANEQQEELEQANGCYKEMQKAPLIETSDTPEQQEHTYKDSYRTAFPSRDLAPTTKFHDNSQPHRGRHRRICVTFFARALRWTRKITKIQMFDSDLEKEYWKKRHPLFLKNTASGMVAIAMFSFVHAFLDPLTYCGSWKRFTPGMNASSG
jgi:hypothetical protein